jgi:RNA polymerase-interacting CarD/CdnL/TRCF family regulator
MTTKKPAQKKPAAKKPAAKKPAAKKPAAKKPAAKKPAAKKPAAKKPAAKKPAAKKPAAKKPAAKKPAAKKPAARNPAASKSAARKPATKAEAKPRPAPKPKPSKFKVQDKVVYPHHGAAIIVKKEKQPVDGKRVDYFVLEVATDQLIVRVPVDRAEELGVRPVISKNAARKVFAVFRDEPQEAGSNWSRWYKVLTEKINSGDIYQVAEVVRDLTYAQQLKGISPALKRMLSKAHLILNSELRFALNLDEDETEKRILRALPKVEVPDEG